jgi:hypothetical protein
VNRIEIQGLLEVRKRFAKVRAVASVPGAGKQDVALLSTLALGELLGPGDPVVGLVSVFREPAGEQQPLDGGLPFCGAACQVAREVQRRIVAVRRIQIPRIGLELARGGVLPGHRGIEQLNRAPGAG